MGIKRLFDFGVSLILLVLTLPLMFLLITLVYLRLGSPVFFIQTRPGFRGQPFRMFKFRTMVNVNDNVGRPLPDDKRVTNFGLWLRSTSLDELPELWNVLKGEMSLVGPRPLLMEYLDLYTQEQFRRHEVLPGITGWAQVNGRNAIGWSERLEMDVWYVENASLMLDLKILLATVKTVFLRKGVAAEGEVTVSRFKGSGEKASRE